jgi:glycosyltransferase involved in cell wall biosynthesis
MLRAVLVTLGDPGKLTGGYLYHRRMSELAPLFGARLMLASFPERPFPLPALAAPAVLRRAYRLRPHVLVVDSIAAAFLGPWFGLVQPRIPVAGMLHQPPGGIDYGPARSMLQARLDRLAYRRAGLLMPASDSLREELIAQGVPRALTRVVPPGRDVAATASDGAQDPRAKEALRRGRAAAILCVGNWVERKGIHSLLEAFAMLPAETATLHLAGDDRADPRYATRLRERLRKPDLPGRVVVHGPLSVDEVGALYRAADLFVLPSLKEPYGTVYGEAMACGLPVIGWRAGNLPYLAEHEKEGLLVQPGDLEGLAKAMYRLSTDEVLRTRLGEAARQRALQRPTWKESAALFYGSLRDAARG